MDAGTGWPLSEPQVSPDTHSYVPTHRNARASYVPRRPERRIVTNRYDLFDIEHSTTRASVCATRVLSSPRLTKGCHGSTRQSLGDVHRMAAPPVAAPSHA